MRPGQVAKDAAKETEVRIYTYVSMYQSIYIYTGMYQSIDRPPPPDPPFNTHITMATRAL